MRALTRQSESDRPEVCLRAAVGSLSLSQLMDRAPHLCLLTGGMLSANLCGMVSMWGELTRAMKASAVLPTTLCQNSGAQSSSTMIVVCQT